MGEKLCQLYIWLITRIYKELKKLNFKKICINDSMKKWVDEMKWAFSKEELQMTKNIWRNAKHPWP
jgi:hypothetical protein